MPIIKIRNLINDGWIDFDQFDDARTLTAGSFLTGGGDLSANRRFDVDDSLLALSARTLTAGSFLTGGGDLSANRRFDFAHATLGTLLAGTFYTETEVDTIISALAASGVPEGRTLTAGSYLSGGGDLSANRRFDVDNSLLDARYLYKENVSAFTPDGDYEPATKKYVDDTAGALPAVAGTGYALVSDGVNSWAADQTPLWTGDHSFGDADFTHYASLTLKSPGGQAAYVRQWVKQTITSASKVFLNSFVIETSAGSGDHVPLFSWASDASPGGAVLFGANFGVTVNYLGSTGIGLEVNVNNAVQDCTGEGDSDVTDVGLQVVGGPTYRSKYGYLLGSHNGVPGWVTGFKFYGDVCTDYGINMQDLASVSYAILLPNNVPIGALDSGSAVQDILFLGSGNYTTVRSGGGGIAFPDEAATYNLLLIRDSSIAFAADQFITDYGAQPGLGAQANTKRYVEAHWDTTNLGMLSKAYSIQPIRGSVYHKTKGIANVFSAYAALDTAETASEVACYYGLTHLEAAGAGADPLAAVADWWLNVDVDNAAIAQIITVNSKVSSPARYKGFVFMKQDTVAGYNQPMYRAWWMRCDADDSIVHIENRAGTMQYQLTFKDGTYDRVKLWVKGEVQFEGDANFRAWKTGADTHYGFDSNTYLQWDDSMGRLNVIINGTVEAYCGTSGWVNT